MTSSKKRIDGQPYWELRDEVRTILEKLATLDKVAGGNSEVTLSKLEGKTREALFTVAIAGPSRVGKSTLINALLRTEASPVNKVATTGVPCLYEPGPKDEIIVTIKGEESRHPFTIENVAKYATQKENPENRLGVERLKVTLSKPALSLGYAILDLPGLDDPSDTIGSLAELGLEGADAIVYVLNGGSYATGSFILQRDEKDDLKRFVPRKDKAFVVVNKADVLDAEQTKELRELLEGEFKRFDLIPLSDENLFMVSAKKSFEARVKGSAEEGPFPVKKFEDKLLSYLIHHNDVGRNRVRGILSEAYDLVATDISISALALQRSERVLELRKYLPELDASVGKIARLCTEGSSISGRELRVSLSRDLSRFLPTYEAALRSVPIAQPLPSRGEIKQTAERQIAVMAENARRTAQQSFGQQASRANDLVRKVVQPLAQDMQSLWGNSVNVQGISSLGVTENFNLWTPFWGTLGLGLVGLIFGPVGAVIGGLIGLVIGLFVGEAQRRDKEINDVIGRLNKAMNDAADKIEVFLQRQLDSAYAELQVGLADKVQNTRKLLQRELEHLGDPLSNERRQELQLALSQLTGPQGEIAQIVESLAQ